MVYLPLSFAPVTYICIYMCTFHLSLGYQYLSYAATCDLHMSLSVSFTALYLSPFIYLHLCHSSVYGHTLPLCIEDDKDYIPT